MSKGMTLTLKDKAKKIDKAKKDKALKSKALTNKASKKEAQLIGRRVPKGAKG